MRFDEHDFETTAEVLLTINDAYKSDHLSHIQNREDLINFMRSCAYTYLYDDTKSRNMSTGGFHLSTFRDHDGELVVRATVTAYCVKIYLSKLQKRLDTVLEAA